MSAAPDRGADRAIELGDTTLRYRVAGEAGAAVVYLHGVGMPRWTPALDDLAREYRIYGPELPGGGRSVAGARPRGAQDVADVVGALIQAALPGERAHVVGTSAGATIALWVALRHPDAVGRLVLVSPTAFQPEVAEQLARLSPEERRACLYVHPERAAELAEAGPEEAGGIEPLYDLEGSAEALRGQLAGLETSVLALFGTKDTLVPSEMARVYRAQIPHGQVIFVYNARHALHVDRPAAFVQLVDAFLAEGEGIFRNRGATGYMRAPEGRPPTGAV
jgi:pimeloyl-ACP methyl ester carboxylesterase